LGKNCQKRRVFGRKEWSSAKRLFSRDFRSLFGDARRAPGPAQSGARAFQAAGLLLTPFVPIVAAIYLQIGDIPGWKIRISVSSGGRPTRQTDKPGHGSDTARTAKNGARTQGRLGRFPDLTTHRSDKPGTATDTTDSPDTALT